MRPLEYLASLKGKRVVVTLKNGKEIEGTLESSDIHVNLVLSNAKIEDKEVPKVFVRGDMVLFVREFNQ